MFESLLEAARRACDGERALADVRALARVHRIQASPGYDAAADWMEEAIRRAGLTPERVSVAADGRTRHLGFPMPEGWRCRDARATLHGAGGPEPLADFSQAPLSIVQRSDRAQGRFPLVALDALDALETTDVRGKVVLSALP